MPALVNLILRRIGVGTNTVYAIDIVRLHMYVENGTWGTDNTSGERHSGQLSKLSQFTYGMSAHFNNFNHSI